MTPVVLYDNACYLCIKFASAVSLLARGRITLVGHHTELGERIRREHLDPGAAEMFWCIDGKNAYGGRCALLPLARAIIFSTKNPQTRHSAGPPCDVGCKTPKAVFIRSASLLTHCKKIKLD